MIIDANANVGQSLYGPRQTVDDLLRSMDAPVPGGLGGTFAGNPVACAAALAVLDVLRDERLCERAQEIGEVVRARFLGWRSQDPCMGDVRGLGAMQAIELVTATGAPDGARAAAVQREAATRGLLVLTAGTSGNVIRLLMPLSIPRDVLQRGLDMSPHFLDLPVKWWAAASTATAVIPKCL